jgi:hypothetical protein
MAKDYCLVLSEPTAERWVRQVTFLAVKDPCRAGKSFIPLPLPLVAESVQHALFSNRLPCWLSLDILLKLWLSRFS